MKLFDPVLANSSYKSDLFYPSSTLKTHFANGLFDVSTEDNLGWPYHTPELNPSFSLASSPLIVDIDNDGKNEVIFSSTPDDGRIYVVDSNGEDKSGWPVQVPYKLYNYIGLGSPAVADINGDGNLEIFFQGTDYAYGYDHLGQPLPHWPIDLRSPASLVTWRIPTPVIVDLNNDGIQEIIIVHLSRTFHVFEPDGSYFPGWPITDFQDSRAALDQSPAVADLDNDGFMEIVINDMQGVDYNSRVFIYNHDGTAVAGWPRVYENRSITVSPVITDLNNDGKLDIIETGLITPFKGFFVTAFNIDGKILNEDWPLVIPAAISSFVPRGFALADINGDGSTEVLLSASVSNGVLFPQHGTVFAIRNTGNLIWRGEVSYYPPEVSSPVVADITNDNTPEILLSTGKYWLNDLSYGQIVVYDKSGEINQELVKTVDEPITTTIALGDVTGNEKFDIVVPTTRGTVYLWETQGNIEKSYWPFLQYNPQRTGFFDITR
ncbi:VCBS repeat-containing protein [Candidatus Nomurabacteria bacterium]|nr:VCBS repeat-containing protein [Candidatus Nomurabacteria bacterium]